MKNRISLGMLKNFTDSLLGLLHGIPAARASKEKAEAALKWIEYDERLLEFLKKAGLSEGDLNALIISKTMEKLEKEFHKMTELLEDNRIQYKYKPIDASQIKPQSADNL